jgi:transketolase
MQDQNVINHIKGLVLDGVHHANSGHPGGAFSSSDFAYILFSEFLNFDPQDTDWVGRDRFVLSAGHESMLLYSLLHLQGGLAMDELRNFRQWGSKTPGHPENYVTKGVECTTGPLGQGAAMSVGMAVAASHLANKFGEDVIPSRTYALVGDGCMQEGVTLGAASLAGHLGLNRLVWFYDKNRIQISGAIDRSTSDDTVKIFEGFGWHVLEIDGHDHQAIREALEKSSSNNERPTLIVGNTVIANGAFSTAGSHKTHGAPFKDDERAATKTKLGLDANTDFQCPDEVVKHFQRNFSKKSEFVSRARQSLEKNLSTASYKNLWSQHFEPVDRTQLPVMNWQGSCATRNAFGDVLEAWAECLPSLMGGSADLEPSNMTGKFAAKVGDYNREHPEGRNLNFGVREFPMSAIANGMALFGGVIPFDATFLTFSDYARPALRLAALQRIRVIHEYSHDSFYLGEDGPTHQSIEHVMSMRLIPDFYVMRPADARETEIMMAEALELQWPTAICLTRQKLPLLTLSDQQLQEARKGAYVVHPGGDPEFIIFATGSEVSLALEVAQAMGGDCVQVVSVPCWELFENQSDDYRQKIMCSSIKNRISIEAGSTLGWQKYTGVDGLNIGIDHFGASAPADVLAEKYGFTVQAVQKSIAKHFSK